MTMFNKEMFMKELEILVNIDSGSDDMEGLHKVADYLAKQYEEAGLTVKRTVQGELNRPYMEVYTHPEEEEIDILFLGHLDTVFPAGTVAERPYSLSEDGKVAYGPGVGDMKAGDLLALYLTRELMEVRPDLRICICHNSDEEIGSEDSMEAMQNVAARSRYGFVLEPGRIGGHFVYQRKGVVDVLVKCRGIASHAGNAPKDGASAILALADLITKMSALTDFETGLTVNAGLISGGTGSNVVAEDAEAVFDIRYTSFEQLAEFEAKLDELVKAPVVKGVTATWKKLAQMPPMEPNDRTVEMMDLLRGEAEKLGQKPDFLSVGGASDGSLLSEMGTAVMDGCGPESDKYHSVDEYLLVDTIEERYNLLLGAMKGIGR